MQVFSTGAGGDIHGFESRIMRQQRSTAWGVRDDEISLGIRASRPGIGTGTGPKLNLCAADRETRRIAKGTA